MLDPSTETQAFHTYVGEQIAIGTNKSPEALVEAWRKENQGVAETVEAINESLEDIAVGRTKSHEEADRDFRERHNISADDLQ